MNYCSPPRFRS